MTSDPSASNAAPAPAPVPSDPSEALPSAARAFSAWEGDYSADPSILTDKHLLLVRANCVDTALLKRLSGRTHPQKFGVGSGLKALIEVLAPAARGRGREVSWASAFRTKEGRKGAPLSLGRFVDAQGEPVADANLHLLALALSALGGADRVTAFGDPNQSFLAFWRDGLLGALIAAQGGVATREVAPEDLLAGVLIHPKPAMPRWAATGRGRADGVWPFPAIVPDGIPPAAQHRYFERMIGEAVAAIGGTVLPRRAQDPTRRWALAGRTGLVQVALREEIPRDGGRHENGLRFEVTFLFEEVVRSSRALGEPFDRQNPINEDGEGEIRREVGEVPYRTLERIQFALAAVAVAPEDRPTTEELLARAAFATAERAARTAVPSLLGPGAMAPYVAVPADALEQWSPKGKASRHALLDRQTWRPMRGSAPAKVIARHVARLNALTRAPLLDDE